MPRHGNLEALYLPYKPKRRTRATAARERGLQPLADVLKAQKPLGKSKAELLKPSSSRTRMYRTPTRAPRRLDIIAEEWCDDAETRLWMTKEVRSRGRVVSQVKRGKKEEAAKFDTYLDTVEKATKIPSHRMLAMLARRSRRPAARGSGTGTGGRQLRSRQLKQRPRAESPV